MRYFLSLPLSKINYHFPVFHKLLLRFISFHFFWQIHITPWRKSQQPVIDSLYCEWRYSHTHTLIQTVAINLLKKILLTSFVSADRLPIIINSSAQVRKRKINWFVSISSNNLSSLNACVRSLQTGSSYFSRDAFKNVINKNKNY